MKNKIKSTSLFTKDQNKINTENDRRRKNWRTIWLRLTTIFLIIVFLASECATLLPVE